MKKINYLLAWFLPFVLSAQDTLLPEPFSHLDLTWCNGSDHRTTPTLQGKHFTPVVMVDANYTQSNHNPIDNTVVGSTALARNNEVQLSAVHLGGDFSYKQARAHIVTQFGTRSTVIPRNDLSPYKGQYQLADAYRYLAEANAGFHFNKWYGINVDMGMFMSYIGLNSYYQTENWEYQASFTSDNTPWFFNGIRVQIFPKRNLKMEAWIINGWQSYGMYNHQPGLGGNITWCPNASLKLLSNNYYGADAAGVPQRKRFHSDNSLLCRYYNGPNKQGISRMALSLTGDFGCEKGGGVNGFNSSLVAGPAQYFLSAMLYNRIWFHKNTFAITMGGGVIDNPGRYLVLAPTGQASPLPNPIQPTSTAGSKPFSMNPGDPFKGYDCSFNLEWTPEPNFAVRLEYVYRKVNVPYFAGPSGVTSPNGYTTNALSPEWAPDLVNSESRIILAILFRL